MNRDVLKQVLKNTDELDMTILILVNELEVEEDEIWDALNEMKQDTNKDNFNLADYRNIY